MSPKGYKAHYISDGSGRDTYVNWGSGGFFKQYSPREQFHPGSFVTVNKNKSLHLNSPVLSPLPVHYHNNGSGRDSYISHTDGGLTHNRNTLVDFRQAFKDSLRRQDRLQTSYVKQGGHDGGIRRSLRSSLQQMPRPASND